MYTFNDNLNATPSSTPKLKFIYDNNDKLYFYLFIWQIVHIEVSRNQLLHELYLFVQRTA